MRDPESDRRSDIKPGGRTFAVDLDGDEVRMSYTFFRGENANFLPKREAMRQANALSDKVLAGWMPAAPIIDGETTIVAFGSCFAGHISRYLNALGFDVATKRDDTAYVSKLGDGIVNVFAIRQQFEWAWENKVPQVDLWHGFKAEEFGYDEAVRRKTRELFDKADVFIITLGLSEVWYDEPTGEVFWRAVPYDKYDPARHKFRVASSAETLTHLRAVYDLIRAHRPGAAIVFTVSPIPLSATFRPVSCITANSASKALLRAAVDELYREKSPTDDRLFYFPAYEVVTQCFEHAFTEDFRHPYLHVLDVNMKAFERYFCATGMTDEALADVYQEARRIDRALGQDGADLLSDVMEQARVTWGALSNANIISTESPDKAARKEEARRLRLEAKAERIAQRDARRRPSTE